MAQRAFLEFYNAHLLEVIPLETSIQTHLSGSGMVWQPPSPSTFKINTDAALSLDGLIVLLVCSLRQPWMQFSSPTIGEALAIRFAIQLALQHGHTDLIIENDNMGVIQAL
ncbi:hypothetical protein NE237_007674 [Protea cynaroides]|uniref:RNase H type-1 domain-containing protein n=1 Tax=Protea cynaroides TaxID=273540 RepID=A0A9Q0QWB6_9MAGN|nr:hypothetical protein NE237_007674 [Protea cynaroides]